jgi:PAS domain S-box-containing protein
MNDTQVPGRSTAEILERVFAGVDVMLAYMDRNFTFLAVNRAYAEAEGRPAEYYRGRNYFDLRPDPGDQALFRRAVATGETVRASERRSAHPERGVAWWDWLLRPVMGPMGRVEGLVLSRVDVTDKVTAREHARQAAAYARGLIEASPDPLVTIGADGRITDVNAATEAVTGRTRGVLVGTDFSDYFTEPERARAGYRRVFAEGTVRDYALEIRRADGAITAVLYNATVYRDQAGKVAGVFAAARDITRRRRAEEALRAAGLYNRSLIEASLDPLVTIGADGRIMDVNAATEKVTGCRREDLIGTDFSDYFTSPEHARDGYQQVFREGFVRDYPLEIRHVDGHTTPVLYNAAVYRDEAGKVAGVFAAARDVAELKRAEREVADLARRNRLILESAGEGIYGLDIAGHCTFANPAAALMLGFTVEEMQGQVMHALVHHTREDGRAYPVTECPVNDAYLDGTVRRGTDFYWRKDGSGFPVEFVSTPITEAGQTLGAVVTFRDITERRRAEQELHSASLYARSLIEASLDPLVTISPQGKITDVNQATVSVTGVPRERLIDTDFSDYFTEPERARAGYREVFSKGLVTDYPLTIRRQDGHLTHVLYNAALYRNQRGDVVGVFAAARDVTERLRAEQALQELNRELEQRVRERTAALEEANRELESFSYSVSHDLRTPLRAVDGFSKMLLTDYADRLDEEGRRLLQVVRDNSEKMGELIADILNFSRTGRAEMKTQPVDMKSLAREAWDEVRELESGREFDFRLEPLPPAIGDRNLLRQVLVNLVSNAVKFTRGRPLAVIEVGGRVEGAENLYWVKDNGVGFDMHYVERLFGVFQRLHSTEQFEGTGVGLAIVKRIVQRHGGRIWAEGSPGGGAIFRFTLPGAETAP